MTINNPENLIEKVGGIEKAREIVKWQSKSSWADHYCISESTIGSAGRKFSEELCLKNNDFVLIDDLRTAIAEHDSREFKVGDLVVCTDDFASRKDLTAKDIAYCLTVKTITAFIDDWGLDLNNGMHWVDTYRFRHATPEEIKSGHRLEAERHG